MIPRAMFGRTGHESSRLLFGAAALSKATRAEADRALGLVLDAGVNHIDVAASYGIAEERLGPALKGRREEFFLATKTDKRSGPEARKELEASLRLLGTDRVDLWQMHCLVDEAEWATAMGEGGVLEAFVEARERGLVRFLGVTGHGLAAPAMHARSLERFSFDSVLLPWNWAMSRNAAYAEPFRSLVAECGRRGIAIQLIKSICKRPWGERAPTHATWYEPLEGEADMATALGFCFAVPGAFTPSAGDLGILPTQLAAAARDPAPPSEEDCLRLAARTGMAPLFA
jgi:aryl-alcohol dehydrogenase-like predicted oxidoreductase